MEVYFLFSITKKNFVEGEIRILKKNSPILRDIDIEPHPFIIINIP